ncbi:aspartate--tRNA ligase [Candidatus Calescamantes bacterium]|nr:aspartate--tRNA ligase [Candidatus Calescamantes bacterium]
MKKEIPPRTCYCGEVGEKHIGREIQLYGWVRRMRDHGGLTFVDLADREGVVQIVFNPEENISLHKKVKRLKAESVVGIKGIVRKRPSGTENPRIKTGNVEVIGSELVVFSMPSHLPFTLDEKELTEEVRLKYRYLDLRRDEMLRSLRLRHHTTQTIREYLSSEGFWEVETPFLTRSTPEGARDYLVPSRIYPGKFYALPQSPQLFKQLLMVGGVDKYFQIVKCFRDEDLRADRQPEFTQIDLEISFVDEKKIMEVTEHLLQYVFKKVLGKEISLPFPSITYLESLHRYGTDRPDIRFGLEIRDFTDVFYSTSFRIFKEIIEKGDCIKGINIPEGSKTSLKEREAIIEKSKELGASGLVWLEFTRESIKSPIAKFLSEEEKKRLKEVGDITPGDLLILVAGEERKLLEILGNLRLFLAKELNLINPEKFQFIWVTDFPLFEYSEEERRWSTLHHPFTSPREEDIPLLKSDPGKVKSRAYDIVLNGEELGGGSIRIHEARIQKEVFEVIGIPPSEYREKFGFLLDALNTGAPPHGGIALGMDRLLMIMSGADSIREVIAFPKTQKAVCLVTNSPSSVTETQLRELHMKVRL